MKQYCHLFLASMLLLLTCFLYAQKSVPDTLFAMRINEKIEVDGDLEEDPWEVAKKISNFTQRELEEGQPATEKTEVAILYDESHLYIGLWAYDSEPDNITVTESKRDFSWQSEDNFEIIIGTFNDNRNGYLFVINPNAAMADVLVTDGGAGFNQDWNGVWEAAVEVDEEGWFAEIEIPFSTLKFPDADEHVWALNMERNIRRKKEQVLWQGWSRDHDLEKIAHAGKLAGLKGIRTTTPLEIKPYINAGLEKIKNESVRSKIKFGGDLNYLITPKIKFNLTINTDFSQVESDREEINLTRFSLFYPEKREFFLEGKNLFEFNLGQDAHLFYSRRIGLHKRKGIPILGGVRLVGKAGKTNIGLMSLQTSDKDSIPTVNHAVLRIKQEVLEQSNVGLIFTSRNDARHSNHVVGFDANYSTSRIFTDKNLDVGFAVSQSYTDNHSDNKNIGYKAFISYPNDFVEFDLFTSKIEKNYNPEMGFLRRKDYRFYYSQLQLNPRPAFIPFIKNFEFVPFELEYYFTDHNHKLETVEMEFRPVGFEFKSGDTFEFNFQRFFDRLDGNYEIVDDIEIASGEYWFNRYELGLESYTGRRIFSEAQFSWGEFYNGKRRELEFQLGWNLYHKLNLSADWEQNDIELGNEKFTTNEVGGRLEYAFNPDLYASVYSQWNNEDNEAILNYRINWIPAPGSYFYFVVNQELSTDSNTFVLMNTTVITKLIWRFSDFWF